MWLPTPVYERVPQFWLLLGLLFMSSGIYLGFEYSLSFIYLGIGSVCVIWSAAVLVKRSRSRAASASELIETIEADAQNQEPTSTPD